MKIEKTDKRGVRWVVESPGEVDVIICPACGNAAFLISKTQPAIQKIKFQREGSDGREITIGEIPLDVARGHLEKSGEDCPWCGFPIRFESEQ